MIFIQFIAAFIAVVSFSVNLEIPKKYIIIVGVVGVLQFDVLKYAPKIHDTLGSNCIGLKNVRMKYSGWYFPIFYTSETCHVTGNPVYVTKHKNMPKKRRAKK